MRAEMVLVTLPEVRIGTVSVGKDEDVGRDGTKVASTPLGRNVMLRRPHAGVVAISEEFFHARSVWIKDPAVVSARVL
jgi:hypothetical protein